MPSVAVSYTPYLGTQAQWIAWCQAVSGALDTIGLTKVADTGAVASWTTQTKPATSGLQPFFEIRRLSAPQTGAPAVYMRFNYGTGASSSVYPGLTIQTGTGTDGAGNLTGPGSTIAATYVTANNGENATRVLYAASDGDGFILAHAVDSALAMRSYVAVDRQRRADGVAAPNSGWPNIGYMRAIVTTTTPTVVFVDPVSGDVLTVTKMPAVTGRTLATNTSMVNSANEMTMWPILSPNRQGLYNFKMALVYPVADANLGTDLVTNFLGANRTYRALGDRFSQQDANNSPGATIAMWWSD